MSNFVFHIKGRIYITRALNFFYNVILICYRPNWFWPMLWWRNMRIYSMRWVITEWRVFRLQVEKTKIHKDLNLSYIRLKWLQLPFFLLSLLWFEVTLWRRIIFIYWTNQTVRGNSVSIKRKWLMMRKSNLKLSKQSHSGINYAIDSFLSLPFSDLFHYEIVLRWSNSSVMSNSVMFFSFF